MPTPNFKPRTLFTRDNLQILRGMNSECVDLIYIDPPFNSNVVYQGLSGKMGSKHEEKVDVFSDVWRLTEEDNALHQSMKEEHRCIYEVIEACEFSFGKNMKSYLINMTVRLFEMERILKPTGSFYLHCDPTASHYLKIVLDCVFGVKNFRNEIVWCYGGRGMAKRWFNKKHDIILFYSKSKDHFFNTEGASRPVAEEHVGRYNKVDAEGKKYARIKNKDGSYSNIYLKDVVREDWWNIPYVRGAEATGYPTQKPLELLERIIKASSNEGDLVLDAFCGCATTMVAAEKLKRKWVGIDMAPIARHLVRKRLIDDVFVGAPLIKEYEPILRTDIPEREDVEKGEQEKDIKEVLFILQEERCNGCCHQFPKRSLTKDHIVATSKGGQDIDSNLQLLCGFCNSTKGDRTQEYLLKRLDELGIRDIEQAEC